jgi:hypothetical protein
MDAYPDINFKERYVTLPVYAAPLDGTLRYRFLISLLYLDSEQLLQDDGYRLIT